MSHSLLYPLGQERFRFSIEEINTRANRSSIDQQYSELVHKRQQRQEKQRRETDDYIKHLEEENQKLYFQIQCQKEKHEKQVAVLKERVRAKDCLLEECEREIGKIRKQYEVIDRAILKQKGGQQNIQKVPNHKHGLIKQKKQK